jgi:hypothetical protein
MLKKTFLLLCLIHSASGLVNAQNAFETVSVAVGGDVVMAGNTIINHWDASPGFTLDLRSPYHKGEFEAGARYIRYNEYSFADSGFRSVFVYLGWHYPFRITGRLSLAPGFRIGNHFLYQDNAREYYADPPGDPFIFHEDESEFAYEAGLRLQYDISSDYSMYVYSSYNRTLLEIPYSVAHATFGISRTFSTPGWLQKFVR